MSRPLRRFGSLARPALLTGAAAMAAWQGLPAHADGRSVIERQQLMQAGIMPGFGAGVVGAVAGQQAVGYAAFPAAYQTLIESFDEADRIHVNGATGNDSTGDGSIEAPYATIPKAMSVHVAGQAIIVFPGTYTPTTSLLMRYLGGTTAFTSTYTECLMHDMQSAGVGRECHYIGCAGQTIITPNYNQAKDYRAFVQLLHASSTCRGFWFKRDNGARTNNYAVSIANGYLVSTSNYVVNGLFENCLFEELNANGKMSFNYSQASHSWDHSYCSYIASDMLASYTAASAPTVDRGQVEYTGTTPENGATFTNMNKEVEFDSEGKAYDPPDDYSDNTNFGVYGGTYAWPL